MNKTIAYVASLATVVGLGAAWTFGKIDGTAFGLISTAVLTAIAALYQKFQNNDLKAKITNQEDKIFELEFSNKKLEDQKKGLETQVKQLSVVSENTAEVVEKPKRNKKA